VIVRIGLALIIASAIWLALSVTIVLWPPATLGLVIAAATLARGVVPSPRAVLSVTRRHLRASYVWGVVNGAILALVIALDRYAPLAERVSPGVETVCEIAAIIWAVLQLYALPLLLVQRDGRMLSAWRSAALMALASPFSTALLGLLAALIVGAARTWPLPGLLIAPGLLALLGSAVVKSRLSAYGHPADPPIA